MSHPTTYVWPWATNTADDVRRSLVAQLGAHWTDGRAIYTYPAEYSNVMGRPIAPLVSGCLGDNGGLVHPETGLDLGTTLPTGGPMEAPDEEPIRPRYGPVSHEMEELLAHVGLEPGPPPDRRD